MTDSDALERLVARGPTHRTVTGLLVVMSDAQPPDALPGWRVNEFNLAVPEGPLPSLLDQFVAVPTEADLEFEESSSSDIRGWLARVGYQPGTVWSARFLRRLSLVRGDLGGELRLIKALFGDAKVVGAYEAFASGADDHDKRALISEQQLHVLMRLVLESAAPDATGFDEAADYTMKRAMIATSSVVGDAAARIQGEGQVLDDWIGFLAQNGVYNVRGDQLQAYQRVWRIYVELASSEQARAHPLYCPFDEWSIEQSGASIEELVAVGFHALATVASEQAQSEMECLVAPMSLYLANTPLADRHAFFAEALSGSREYFQQGFARSRDDPIRLAWDMTPFLRKPFLMLEDEALLLLSPRALHSWLTDGVHYRLLDRAIAVGRRERFSAFVGHLFESYVLEVLAAGLAGCTAGEGRVHGEQRYSGDQRTSDVAIDYGVDLVLCEVVSTRLPLGVRAEADQSELDVFLKRTILDKLSQLDRVVNDLVRGAAHIPGVDMAAVERVWPVLINVGEVVEGEALWSFINGQAIGLRQTSCRPLTLLGVDEVETLAGMAATGENVVSILSAKQRDNYGELGFRRWLADTRDTAPPRLPVLEARWDRMSKRMVDIVKPIGSASTS